MFRYCTSNTRLLVRAGMGLLLATLLGPPAVRAQAPPSFIVRLDGAPPGLVAALDGDGAAKQGAFAALFEDVGAVRNVFAEAARTRAPFPAYVLTVADSSALARQLDRWARQPGLRYVQPNHRYGLDATPAADPLLDSLSHLPVIRAFEAWAISDGEAGVRIGFVDTGLFFEHPDLAGQVWINPGEDLDGDGRRSPADFNGIDDDGNGFVDDVAGYDFVDRPEAVEVGDYRERDGDAAEAPGTGNGHGTLVAGILAARRGNDAGGAGVAPGTRLVPLRAFGADGLGEDDDVAAAIVYAAQLGLDVLNLSFGDVYASPLMHEAIQYAVRQGVVVVASAGNLGGDAPHYPSDYPEVLSVAWLTQDGDGLSGRGTYGLGIDLGAPGSATFTTLLPRLDEEGDIDPETLYGRRSGSSTAAPMVAAAAGLLRSLDPDLSPASIRAILTASAHDLREPGWDHRTGAGRLDVAEALLRAVPARVALTRPAHDGGIAGGAVPILGTAVDPAFAHYELFFTPGDEDLGDAWTSITGPVAQQRLDDTLAVWQTDGLADGVYTLRLEARLRSGRSIEDRRRVFLDRTPPEVVVEVLEVGLLGGRYGVVADVRTDDLSDLTMEVTVEGPAPPETVESDRRARHHGLAWADADGRGGRVLVRFVARNAAGLETVVEERREVPVRVVNTAFLSADRLDVPHGYLLPTAPDFDGDGLREIVFNQYKDGWIGDTLAVYEWDGGDFRPAQKLIANVIPRDVADADGDGLAELLTQVGGATLVLEQEQRAGYPLAVSFIDTTGLRDPFAGNAAFGARLTDLDGDGRGEILAHNTHAWRVLEWNGTDFQEIARLENPTTAEVSEISENEFQQPLVLVEDFDGDGRQDLLVGDGDGDWIVYETTGDDAFRVAWTFETTRYNASARLAAGDFDGDGRPEFVTFTQNWTQPTSDDAREPDLGLYYVWDQAGDDDYRLAARLPVPGMLSRHGTLAAADFDGDGRDELVLVHAPDLYVLGFDGAMGWQLRYHHRPEAGARSAAATVGDFDGDGRPELVIAHADAYFHRYVYDDVSARVPPVWRRAYGVADAAVLTWYAPSADSVTVFQGTPGEAFDPVATVTGDSLQVVASIATSFALRAWQGGQPSPLSDVRTVRPHAPARVVEVVYPAPTTVELVFSEALAGGLRAADFVLAEGGPAAALLPGRSGHSVVLRFEALAARMDVLTWPSFRDAEGTPVGQQAIEVAFPDVAEAGLFVQGWDVLSGYQVVLRFSEALDEVAATQVANYRLEPAGRVVAAVWRAETPSEVEVTVEGRLLGATGQPTRLVVEQMTAASGRRLAAEGTTVLLTEAAESLADVYVYPNPVSVSQHGARVIVAGLPEAAQIDILTLHGMPLRRLDEDDGDGGAAWDLRDEAGALVPSGVYLVRVETPEGEAVLRKAVVVR